MLNRRLQQISGSFFIGIPAQIAQMMGLTRGDQLRIDYENKKIIMTLDAAAKQSPAPADTPTKRYQHE